MSEEEILDFFEAVTILGKFERVSPIRKRGFIGIRFEELGEVLNKAFFTEKDIDTICDLGMGNMIDINLIVLFEIGANILSDFSKGVLRGVGQRVSGNNLLCDMIKVLLDFHELYSVLFELVLESSLFEFEVLLDSPLFEVFFELGEGLL